MSETSMSTLELPDEVYRRLKEVAEHQGVSPAEWIEGKLSGEHRPVDANTGQEEGDALSETLKGYIGIIDTLQNPVSEKNRTALGDMVAEKLAKQGIRAPWQR